MRTSSIFALVLALAACPAPPATGPSSPPMSSPPTPVTPSVSATPPVSDEVSALRSQPLEFTRHARCRMECRHIDEGEVREILNGAGTLQPDRTRRDRECPSYALEGTTSEQQRVRIVYAGCERRTKVITVIDLGQDWPCGDC